MNKDVAAETARLWGLPAAVPLDAVNAADDPDAAARVLREVNVVLSRHLELDSIPQVVRRDGDGGPLIEMLRERQFDELHDTVAGMFDVGRVQP